MPPSDIPVHREEIFRRIQAEKIKVLAHHLAHKESQDHVNDSSTMGDAA